MVPSELVVTFGRDGLLGRFHNVARIVVERGRTVVIRTTRGLELGEVLDACDDRFAPSLGPAAGEIVRLPDAADLDRSTRCEELARRILDEFDQPGYALLDVDVLLDDQVVLHVLPVDEGLDQLAAEIESRHGVTIRFQDPRRQEAVPKAGCDRPGCGSKEGGCGSCGAGGGCSSGGCSRGTAATADQLTTYFADLRQRMEARQPT